MTTDVDIISILISDQRCSMAKTWKADGSIKSYGNAKYFDLEEVQVNGICDLPKLLMRQEGIPNACIIRGKYIGDDQAKIRESEEFKPGKVLRRKTCFDDQPLHTILIEVDNFVPKVSDPSDVLTCMQEYIYLNLPEPFHGVSYHWQLSNSAGHPDKQGTLNVHLWFWLKTPYTSAQLKAWAENINLNADHSVFNPVQVHYTAAPVFDDGVPDPVPLRSGFVRENKDEVDLVIDSAILNARKNSNDPEAQNSTTQHEDLDRIFALETVTAETINDLRSALMALKQDCADDYTSWINVLEALASLKETQFAEEALLLAHEFSQRCPEKYDPEDLNETWKGLKPNQITYRSIFKWAQDDGWINPRSALGAKETVEYSITIDEFENLPDITCKTDPQSKLEVEYPPGIAGDIANYIFNSSRMAVKSFAIAAALTVIAHINGNHAYVRKSDTALNLYQCLIGDTGKGKEDPRKAIKRLLDVVDGMNRANIHESIASGPALLRSLCVIPNTLILFDEFGIHLQNALAEKGTIHQKELFKELMIFFGLGRSYYAGKTYANTSQNIGKIEKPYVNVFGTTTPLELLEGITSKTIDNGLLNRILFFEDDEENPINREPDIQISEDLKQSLCKIVDVIDNSGTLALEYEDGAHELMVQLVEEKTKQGQFANLWSRAEEHTIRIAGLIALGDGKIIKQKHVRWAWRYVKNSMKAFEQKLDTELAETPFQKLIAKALKIIRNASDYSGDRQFGKYCKKGLMPKGKLTKLLKIKSREVDEVLIFLRDSQQIKHCNLEKMLCYSIL